MKLSLVLMISKCVNHWRYPNFQVTGLITQKSFFQGDYVEMKWNNSGTAVLLLTSTDYDATGASYVCFTQRL